MHLHSTFLNWLKTFKYLCSDSDNFCLTLIEYILLVSFRLSNKADYLNFGIVKQNRIDYFQCVILYVTNVANVLHFRRQFALN